MGRARSALAARTSTDELVKTLASACGVKNVSQESFDDFYDCVTFCRENSEELGGPEGRDAWIVWQVGEWAVASDLSMAFTREPEHLTAASQSLGEVVCGAIDTDYEFAYFCLAKGGDLKRLLILEDDEVTDEGFPIEAERGRHLTDFGDEEAERLWVSYGLPTFDFDPEDGHFVCYVVES